MKKAVTLLMAAAALAVMQPLQAQDLEEVLDAHFEVMGFDALSEKDNMVATGKMMQQGMEFPLYMYTQRNGDGVKTKIEVEFQGQRMVIQAYDGEDGWNKMPGMGGTLAVQDLGADQLEEVESSTMEGDLYNYEDLGHEVVLEGEDEFEGSPVYVVSLTKENGNQTKYFIDTETYVLLGTSTKTMVQGQEYTMVTSMGNYEMIDGTAQAMSLTQSISGNTVFTATINEVKFDTELDDSIFTRPQN